MNGINFYRDIEPLEPDISTIFHPRNFSDSPSDWFVVISDIKNSTAVVQAGKQNDVNLVAAGSLIAALNVAKERDVEIPFFFGGDGSTFLAPESLVQDLLTRLALHNTNSIRNFGLEMHIGSVSIPEVIQSGHFIKIAKVKHGSGFNKAFALGDGLKYAEQVVKSSAGKTNGLPDDPAELNMNGLECRWDKVKPPKAENEIACYLIETIDPTRQLEVYRNVLLKTEEIYGNMDQRHPLSVKRLRLFLGFKKVKMEMLARFGRWKFRYFALHYLETLFSHVWLIYNWKIRNLRGRQYLTQLVAGADTLTIDGRIITIISGRKEMRMQFLKYLESQEIAGHLIYGHHIDRESLMTCYIENRDAKHIHFVDGSDGGYTEASKELKQKMKAL